MATLALSVLNNDVAALVLQAAVPKGPVEERPVVKNQVLGFEELAPVSSHQGTRLPRPGSYCKPVASVVGMTSEHGQVLSLPELEGVGVACFAARREASTRSLSRRRASA